MKNSETVPSSICHAHPDRRTWTRGSSACPTGHAQSAGRLVLDAETDEGLLDGQASWQKQRVLRRQVRVRSEDSVALAEGHRQLNAESSLDLVELVV